jgi:hypothetical protein
MAQLTSTFLDMDRRQGIADSAVAAANALSPQLNIEREWAPVRDACYEASAAYLKVADPTSTWESSVGGSSGGVPDVAQTLRLLEQARNGLDQFYDRHRSALDSASNDAASLAAETEAAMTSVRQSGQLLATTDASLLDYPSVQGAREQLESASAQLQAARDRGDLAATRQAIEQLKPATAAVTEALQSAPQREEQARRTVASVRTRIDAVRTRATETRPVISTLLRDFNAKSSADLVDNETLGRTHVGRAEALLGQAVAARTQHRPEEALAYAAQARTELAEAERYVDDVADRLGLLREVRADPEKGVGDVRFRLRDAQRLAVDRGAVPQWGTVLDAQAARLDRIVADLGGPHPDYWAYHQALGDVAEFIANVVSRIRQGAVR